jgi:fluoride exporter
MRLFLLACAGGAVGAGLRHLVNTATVRVFGLGVPWATLAVNVVGSFVMGVLTAFFVARMPDVVGMRIFMATGLLGGFTTFSAFSLDVAVMAERGDPAQAGIYILASVLLSIGACVAGLYLSRGVLA